MNVPTPEDLLCAVVNTIFASAMTAYLFYVVFATVSIFTNRKDSE